MKTSLPNGLQCHIYSSFRTFQDRGCISNIAALRSLVLQQLHTSASICTVVHIISGSHCLWPEMHSAKVLQPLPYPSSDCLSSGPSFEKEVKIAQCKTGRVWWVGKHHSIMLGRFLLPTFRMLQANCLPLIGKYLSSLALVPSRINLLCMIFYQSKSTFNIIFLSIHEQVPAYLLQFCCIHFCCGPVWSCHVFIYILTCM